MRCTGRSRWLVAPLSSLMLAAAMVMVVPLDTAHATGPPINVDSNGDDVYSGNNDWRGSNAIEVSITVSRGDTTAGPWTAELDQYGHFGRHVEFDIQVGDTVTVSNNEGMATEHTMLGITVAFPDVTNQTVQGTAPDGSEVTVHAFAPDHSTSCERVVLASGGTWLADFSGCDSPVTPFVIGDSWTNNPFTFGDASFIAPDGNTESTGWSAFLPAFWANPENDVVGPTGGCQWGSGNCGSITGIVALTISRGTGQVFPESGSATTAIDPWGNWQFNLTDQPNNPGPWQFDFQPGDIVTVSDGLHPVKQLIVAAGGLPGGYGLAVTDVDPTAQTVTGTVNAPNDAIVIVDAYGENQSCRQLATVTNGVFTADFSACDPAFAFVTGNPWTNSPSTGGSAYLPDADYDATQTNWATSLPAFSANPETDFVSSVGGCQWGNGNCGSITGSVAIAIWRAGSNPDTDQPAFTRDLAFNNQPGNGDFGAQLTGYDLLPGDIVRVSDGLHPTKQLVVATGFGITAIDTTAQTVTGTTNAPDGTTVVVEAYPTTPGPSCRQFATVTGGAFTADFSTTATEPCDPAFSFAVGDPWANPPSPATNGAAYLLDDDFDATHTNWSTSLPVFRADPGQDSVSSGPGCQWGTGNCGSITGTVALTIRRDGNQVFPLSGAATTALDPWGNWNFNLSNQPYNPSTWKFDFQPGDELTVTDGTHTKQLVVAAITSFGADPAANKVFGSASPAEGAVTVSVNTFGAPPGQCSIVEATFDGLTWTADFGVPSCNDLTPMSNGSAWQVDGDGDASVANWQVPNFTVSPQGDQVTGNGWGLGNTVTVSITPAGGVTRAYTVVVPTTTSQYMMPGSFQLCTNQGNPSFCSTIGDPPGLDIQPGATITISHLLPDGTILSSTHVVTAVMITGVNATHTVVRGTATPGFDVQVNAQSNTPGTPPENYVVTPNADGSWSQVFNTPSTFFGASQVDPATNNRTQVGWGVGQPQVVLSPSSNFADGTVVTVQGIGWRPGAPIEIRQCRYPVSGPQDCSPTNFVTTTADADFGDFTAQITLDAQFETNGGQAVDCTGGYPYCSLAVSTTDVSYPDPQFQFQFVSLVFGEPANPQMTVTPNSDLHDGDVVTVHLTDYPPDSYVNLGQCTNSIQVPFYPGGPAGSLCFTSQADPMQQAVTDPNGELTIEIQAARFLITKSTYTVTPDSGLADGQQVTVEGHGYQVADCTTPTAACYFQTVIMQGGPMIGAPPVAMSFAPSSAVPTVDVRQNFLGHVQGGTPPDMYSHVVWPNETAGAITVPLVSEGGGTWGFSTQYTVHRYITVLPEPPYDAELDTLTNPIDCGNLPGDLSEGNSAACIIDVFPHGASFALDYVMNAQPLDFTAVQMWAWPTVGLWDGRSVDVYASGLTPGTQAFVTVNVAANPFDQVQFVGELWVGDDGAGGTTVEVPRWIGDTDCAAAPGTCILVVADQPDPFNRNASQPLTFARLDLFRFTPYDPNDPWAGGEIGAQIDPNDPSDPNDTVAHLEWVWVAGSGFEPNQTHHLNQCGDFENAQGDWQTLCRYNDTWVESDDNGEFGTVLQLGRNVFVPPATGIDLTLSPAWDVRDGQTVAVTAEGLPHGLWGQEDADCGFGWCFVGVYNWPIGSEQNPVPIRSDTLQFSGDPQPVHVWIGQALEQQMPTNVHVNAAEGAMREVDWNRSDGTLQTPHTRTNRWLNPGNDVWDPAPLDAEGGWYDCADTLQPVAGGQEPVHCSMLLIITEGNTPPSLGEAVAGSAWTAMEFARFDLSATVTKAVLSTSPAGVRITGTVSCTGFMPEQYLVHIAGSVQQTTGKGKNVTTTKVSFSTDVTCSGTMLNPGTTTWTVLVPGGFKTGTATITIDVTSPGFTRTANPLHVVQAVMVQAPPKGKGR